MLLKKFFKTPNTKNITLIFLVLGVLFIYLTYVQSNKREFEYAIRIAKTCAYAFNNSDIKALRGVQSDTSLQNYRNIKNKLIGIIRDIPEARFAYIFDERKGKILLLADSEALNSKDYSPPGQEYTEANIDYFLIFKDGKEIYTSPVKDRWGIWRSMLIPIKDSDTGRIIAAFGLDYNARAWNLRIIREIAESSILVLLLYLSILALVKMRKINLLLKDEIAARNKVEAELHTNETKHLSFFESVSTGIVVHLPDTSVSYANPRALEIFGLSDNQILGKYPSDIACHLINKAGDTISMSDYPVAQVIKNKRILKEYIIGIVRPDLKKTIWVSFNGYPGYNTEGELSEIIVTLKDITLLRESQERLEEDEAELIASQHMSGIGSYYYYFDTKCLRRSLSLNTILGIKENEDYSLEDFWAQVHREDRQSVSDYFKVGIFQKEDQFVNEFRILTKDKKEERWIRNIDRFIFNNQGTPIKLIGTIQDITQEKKDETELKTLSLAVEQSPASIMLTNTEGIIEYVNIKTVERTRFPVEELIGQNPRILKSGETPAETYQNLWETILSGKVWRGELLNKKKDGEIFWEETYIAPVTEANGKIAHFIAIKEDITERKRFIRALEEAKIKAESSDKLKTAFMNNISHEVRTPLNGILGFGELLAQNDLSQEDREIYYSYVKNSADRLIRTISDYMEISLIVSGNQEVNKGLVKIAELMDILYEKYQPLSEEKGLGFSLDFPARMLSESINSDSEMILKIMEHLLDNAFKFTTKGEIVFGCAKNKKYVKFFVKDTGIGIESYKLNQLFNTFMQGDMSSTRKYEGNGLGLSIVKGLTTLLDGEIRVESEIGIGSAFYVKIPFS